MNSEGGYVGTALEYGASRYDLNYIKKEYGNSASTVQ